MNKPTAILIGAGLGAATMYLLDPKNGGRRRARVRDKAEKTLRTSTRTVNRLSRDLSNRATGLAYEARSVMENVKPLATAAGDQVRRQLKGMSPTIRALTGACGGTMTYFGVRHRNDLLGATMGLLGLGMLSRGILNRSLKIYG